MRLIVVFLFLSVIAVGKCKKVLGIYSHPGKSHQILGEVLLKKLAERGHEVTMVSAYPLKKPVRNYRDINLDGFLEDINSDDSVYLEMESNDILNFLGAYEMIWHFADRGFGHPAMRKLIDSGEKFDLIVMDFFCKDSELFYGNIFEAPIIFTGSFGAQNELNYLVNNAEPYSYVPSSGFPYTDEMSFFERLGNTAATLFVRGILYYSKFKHQQILDSHFKNAPRIEELYGNVDLVLSNGHPTFETPRPYVPNIISVGGLHVQEPKPLPKDLQDFLDKSPQGVVYFSLGSHMKTSALPQHTLSEILGAFDRINQKVLLKWEKDERPPNLPSNVMTQKWLPQDSILAHPNVKVFITHGGLMGKIEAIYHATPMIGIPVFGDQQTNVVHSVQEGIGLLLYLRELSEDRLVNAINEIINNSSYSENIKKKSTLLRDQPMKPIDTAIYWSEFVMRHNGSKHLQNKGMKLNKIQNLLLDVVAFVGVVVVLILLILWKVAKLLIAKLLIAKIVTKKTHKKVKKH